MKYSNLSKLLHTDVLVLLRKLSFALHPSRTCWQHLENPGHPAHAKALEDELAPLGESDAYSLWSASVLWGNSVFWSPVWGHSGGMDSARSDGDRASFQSQSFPKSGADHAVGPR